MDTAKISGMLKRGVCVVGEFRGRTLETVKYLDRNTKQATHFNQALYRIELEEGGIPVTLGLNFADGKEGELPAFVRGDRVCALLSELKVQRGVYSGRIDGRTGGVVKV